MKCGKSFIHYRNMGDKAVSPSSPALTQGLIMSIILLLNQILIIHTLQYNSSVKIVLTKYQNI